MTERFMKKGSYDIPLIERLYFWGQRLLVIPCLLAMYAFGRYESITEVFIIYFRDYELKKIMRLLNVEQADAEAAIKVLTYIHSLSGVKGEIIEMSPFRCVRIERSCPAARFVSRRFCEQVMSYPTFTALGRAISPALIHSHPSFLSGGDKTCTLVFEMSDRSEE